jgi:hypothetical protein
MAFNVKAIERVQESQGKEGGLAPALVECHSTSGGKPPFLTLSFFGLSYLSNLHVYASTLGFMLSPATAELSLTREMCLLYIWQHYIWR